METVLKAIADWIKGILTAGIMSNLSGLFDDVNTQVGNIAQQVGTKPSSFEPRVFAMIESLSRNVVLPIAGIILTFIACYELIEMITQHNNMAQFEPALIMRWIFKTAVSVWLISNTFDIVMAVFDITQKVVSDSSGIIAGNTRVNDIGLSMLQSSLMQMDVGPLFGLFLQSFFIDITMRILSIIIFVIVYGRMIEIYCMVSLAPIPMATWGNHEQSHMGQNYLKCLFALGFQGFLILICVAIYAVLIQSVAISGDAINSIWSMLATSNAKSIEEIRSFISRQKETYRTPYETQPKDRLRQCVFGGSSNTLDFLPLDRAGNRRFLPVMIYPEKAEVHILEDEAASREYLLQVWAEAMTIYRSGEYSMKFSKEIQKQLVEVQKDFMPEDTEAGQIQGFLEHYTGNVVCSKQLFKEALGHAFEEPKRWQLQNINEIMNTVVTGWKPFSNPRMFAGYGRQRGWEREISGNELPDNEGGFVELSEEEVRQLELPKEWIA